jgi:SAM-dependent methyltransferase
VTAFFLGSEMTAGDLPSSRSGVSTDADTTPRTGAGAPPYAPMLAAYHRAHAAEFRTIIATLPLAARDQVLDLACGDGAHAAWLAERLDGGRVVGVDISPGYLRLARERMAAPEAANGLSAVPVDFCAGAVEALPFADGRLDLAWCAHSLYTLPDPLAALGELRRVVRPGGHVAVLEQDTLHRFMLPWPADLELALLQAQLAGLRRRPNGPDKYFAGRRLAALLEDAGLVTRSVTPFCCVRRAPLDADERCYLDGLLDDLRQKASPYLAPADRERFEILADPRSHHYLPDRPDFHVTYLDVLAVGRRA